MDEIDLLFGKIALKNNFLSQDDLQVCVRARKGEPGKSLGQILYDNGFVNEKQFRAIADYILKKTGTEVRLAAAVAAAGSGSSRAAAVAEAPPPRAPARAPEAAVDDDAPPARGAGGELPPLAELLKRAKRMGASDLHVSPETQVAVRLHGGLKPLDGLPVTTAEMTERRLLEILSPPQRAHLKERFDLDTCLDVPGVGRFRSNIMKQRRGYGGVFRVINERVPTLEELGLPPVLEKFTTYHQGIVLVTGAAGSGKSSTLAALIEIINKNRKDHIITLEDPIEYVFECKKANISQRQIEQHTRSWGNALRASLREDPDVIMVGEMRDLETMRLAVTAAETGHLVLATLHTTNTTRTIDRLLDVFPPKEQAQIRAMVSESLRGIVSQQLVPRADGKGRTSAVEILFNTPAVANLIRERQSFKLYSVLQTGKRLGMKLMDDSLGDLLEKGIITEEQARLRATNPRRFGARAGGDDEGGGGDASADDRAKKRGRSWRS